MGVRIDDASWRKETTVRLNLPITNEEYPFPTGETLVSVTDLKGRILYCNEMFAKVSGFTMEELLGQSHNIIRHPEVPEDAFRDLWETIQNGRPWSAVLKNRRKDGSHYWVVANVTPLFDSNGPVGYMSVRTEATREQIEAADYVLRTMQAEQQAGRQVTMFRNGRVVRMTLLGRLSEALRPDLSGKLLLGLTSLAGIIGALAWWGAASSVPAGWIATASFACVLGLWPLFRRWFVAPIDDLVSCANRIAACDLTQVIARNRSDRYGELQAALGQMSVNIKSIVRDARDQSMRICSNMRAMARDNDELAARTQQQAVSLQETAAALEQVTGAVRSTADASRQAAAESSQAVQVTERSGTAVNELSQTMASIQEASSRIHEIIKVIDGIAFQTNILALNAAVEAARAGEHGKGFAVVASEVRALAQRTSVAAGEIAELITDTTARIGDGHEKTESTLALMKDAVARIQNVHAMVDGIDRASADQFEGISQINAAIGNLDEATGANVSFAARMAESTHELERLAEATTETVRVFRIDTSPQVQRDAVALRRQMKQQLAPALPAA